MDKVTSARIANQKSLRLEVAGLRKREEEYTRAITSLKESNASPTSIIKQTVKMTDQLNSGRVLYKQKAREHQTKRSKHSWYNWVLLDFDADSPISHFEKKRFALVVICFNTRHPLELYTSLITPMISRHCLERCFERLSCSSLKQTLSRLAVFVHTILESQHPELINFKESSMVLVNSEMYITVTNHIDDDPRYGKREFVVITTALPKSMWSAKRQHSLADVMKGVNACAGNVALIKGSIFNRSKQSPIIADEYSLFNSNAKTVGWSDGNASPIIKHFAQGRMKTIREQTIAEMTF